MTRLLNENIFHVDRTRALQMNDDTCNARNHDHIQTFEQALIVKHLLAWHFIDYLQNENASFRCQSHGVKALDKTQGDKLNASKVTTASVEQNESIAMLNATHSFSAFASREFDLDSLLSIGYTGLPVHVANVIKKSKSLGRHQAVGVEMATSSNFDPVMTAGVLKQLYDARRLVCIERDLRNTKCTSAASQPQPVPKRQTVAHALATQVKWCNCAASSSVSDASVDDHRTKTNDSICLNVVLDAFATKTTVHSKTRMDDGDYINMLPDTYNSNGLVHMGQASCFPSTPMTSGGTMNRMDYTTRIKRNEDAVASSTPVDADNSFNAVSRDTFGKIVELFDLDVTSEKEGFYSYRHLNSMHCNYVSTSMAA